MLHLVTAFFVFLFRFLTFTRKQNREQTEKFLYIGIAKGILKFPCDIHEDTLPQEKFAELLKFMENRKIPTWRFILSPTPLNQERTKLKFEVQLYLNELLT